MKYISFCPQMYSGSTTNRFTWTQLRPIYYCILHTPKVNIISLTPFPLKPNIFFPSILKLMNKVDFCLLKSKVFELKIDMAVINFIQYGDDYINLCDASQFQSFKSWPMKVNFNLVFCSEEVLIYTNINFLRFQDKGKFVKNLYFVIFST